MVMVMRIVMTSRIHKVYDLMMEGEGKMITLIVLVVIMVLMMRKTTMIHKVYDLMREGEWKAVCNEFQGEDEYRETLLLWVRRSQVKEVSLELSHQSSTAQECLEWIGAQLQQLKISSISR